jgi:hypothetical protein
MPGARKPHAKLDVPIDVSPAAYSNGFLYTNDGLHRRN